MQNFLQHIKKQSRVVATTNLVGSLVTLLLIPTLAEFFVALHNRYSVYPVGTDTNMLSRSMGLEALLCFLLSVFIVTQFLSIKNFFKKAIVVCGLAYILLIIITFAAIPSFIPRDWCKYELTIYSCYYSP